MTWTFGDLTGAFHDSERHADALLSLAELALRASDFTAAFMFSDRRCRLDASARALLLRSKASRRLGRIADADMDLSRAVEADPSDAEVNLEVLSRGDAGDKAAAAWTIVSDPRAKETARLAALSALGQAGEQIVADLHYDGERILGWAAWSGDEDLVVTADSPLGQLAETIAADARDALAKPLGAAARFNIAAALGESCEIRFRAHGGALTRHASADRKGGTTTWRPLASSHFSQPRPMTITVVARLRDDIDATRLRLQALYRECADDATIKVALVADGAPEEALARLARDYGERPDTLLIVNDRQPGLAGSVNEALACCDESDIVLLDAGVYLTRGAIQRLAKAAYSAPDIGTVTPLANTGLFSGFPRPGARNPTPPAERSDEIDAIASEIFGDATIDIPSGHGFCLFIKNAARARVERLDAAPARAGFEDVDYCLRLAQLGWRNVVATGVFVGHAGAGAVMAEQRALALRNLALLDARFPDYRASRDAFIRADPLQDTRMAIEARLTYPDPVVVLVAAAEMMDGPGDLASRGLTQEGDRVFHVSWAAGTTSIRDLSGAPPRSLDFVVGGAPEGDGLSAFLQRLRIKRCIFIDPALAPAAVLRAFAAIEAPRDILITDPALGDPRGDGTGSREPGPDAATGEEDDWPALLRRVDRVLIEDSMCLLSAAWTLHRFPEARFASAVAPASARWVRKPKRRLRLGVLVPVASAETDGLVAGLARLSRDIALFSPIVLCGGSLNARRLMAAFTVHVTGPIAEEEWDRLVDLMDLGALLLASRNTGFGLLERLAVATSLPVAYFDWSSGVFSPASQMDEASRNLALDPALSEPEACRLIDAWFRRELKPRVRG